MALALVGIAISTSLAQSTTVEKDNSIEVKKTEKPSPWFERINLRGYVQLRYNGLYETNQSLKCDQCDKSWGGDNGFFFRRIRMIFSGNVSDRLFIYIQPDFANTISGALHAVQIRDAYFDYHLDSKKEFRLRFGQSKIPYGFENLQSSSNRIPLDRNDALNSAAPNERDLGLYIYWAPQKIRERFENINKMGLKGSNDYGVVGFGVHNGSVANKAEDNSTRHVVARVSYPFELKNGQLIEPSIQAYSGKFNVLNKAGVNLPGFNDERIAGTIVVYPQPFGFFAEYNVGRGPKYDVLTKSVINSTLKGGFVQGMYRLNLGKQVYFPYVRYQFYDGGKKQEVDAPNYRVRELEFGAELQFHKSFELTIAYLKSHRVIQNSSNLNNNQTGDILRLQAQFNF